MKLFKVIQKVLSMVLVIVLVCSMATTAMASDTASGAAPAEDETSADAAGKTDDARTANEVPEDTVDGQFWPDTLTPHDGDGFLYWASLVLSDQPSLHYDARLKQYYLAFELSNTSKLAALYENYNLAFRLQRKLDELRQLSDPDARIWTKLDWREKSIGEQLSKATADKIKSDDKLDTAAALRLVQASSEYQQDSKLREQVNYELNYQATVFTDVLGGFWLIFPNDGPDDADTQQAILEKWAAMTATELCDAVENFLKENPEWDVLHEVDELAMSGHSSNSLATFEQADPEKIDRLYEQVATASATRWYRTLKLIDGFTFAVPFPVGTSFQWPDGLKETAKMIEDNILPISATGN